MPSILVVEDDVASRQALTTFLEDVGMEVIAAESAEEALARLKLAPVDVVLSDVVMGRMNGIDLLRRIHEQYPETVVVLVSGHASITAAVEAMRQGAFDYLTKPVDLNRLELVIASACNRQDLLRENRRLRDQLKSTFSANGVIGQSRAMRVVLQRVEQVAPTNATVLILGESGTGKELIASAIHFASRRAEAPLVKVNCAALPESLVESELFGHERGAFTGAHQMRRGRFELAHRGSIFLDEIGDLTAGTQVKLLRVLQEREIERVGGQVTIPVDVRLITATNQDLEQEMSKGTFREDLFYRLKVVTIQVPPLRERTDDISPLLEHFLTVYCEEHGRTITGYSSKAKQVLTDYSWPGNVRELRNLVESLVVTTRGEEITLRHLPRAMVTKPTTSEFQIQMGKSLQSVEKAYVTRTISMLGGNKTKAAKVLGIGKKTLYRRLSAYKGASTDHDS